MEYVVVNIERVTDARRFETYIAATRRYLFRFGGELLEVGEAEKRGVWGTSRRLVLGFPSCATLKAWYASHEWKRLTRLRMGCMHGLVSFVKKTKAPRAKAKAA